MTGDRRERRRERAVLDADVGVADAAGDDRDEHFVRFRFGKLVLSECQPCTVPRGFRVWLAHENVLSLEGGVFRCKWGCGESQPSSPSLESAPHPARVLTLKHVGFRVCHRSEQSKCDEAVKRGLPRDFRNSSLFESPRSKSGKHCAGLEFFPVSM